MDNVKPSNMELIDSSWIEGMAMDQNMVEFIRELLKATALADGLSLFETDEELLYVIDILNDSIYNEYCIHDECQEDYNRIPRITKILNRQRNHKPRIKRLALKVATVCYVLYERQCNENYQV